MLYNYFKVNVAIFQKHFISFLDFSTVISVQYDIASIHKRCNIKVSYNYQLEFLDAPEYLSVDKEYKYIKSLHK